MECALVTLSWCTALTSPTPPGRQNHNFHIFHRVRDPLVASPAGCMITPIVGTMLHPLLLRKAASMGPERVAIPVLTPASFDAAPIEKDGNASAPQRAPRPEGAAEVVREYDAYRWRAVWDNEEFYFWETLDTRQPLQIKREKVNATFISITPGRHTVGDELFLPDSVTALRCDMFGGNL